MPRYCVVCPKCSYQDDIFAMIADRPTPEGHNCPKCVKCGATMQRDMQAETGAAQTDWTQPILSDAAGIHPDQIPEARSRFKHHEYAPDGRMVFRSHAHRHRCLTDIGLVDRDGFN